jgi:hypothetical protein
MSFFRACGKVLCSLCCNEKEALISMDNKMARVCKPCKLVLRRLRHARQNEEASPNASMDGQAISSPSKLVGVLKRVGLGGSPATPSDAGVAQAGAAGGAAGIPHSESKQVSRRTWNIRKHSSAQIRSAQRRSC